MSHLKIRGMKREYIDIEISEEELLHKCEELYSKKLIPKDILAERGNYYSVYLSNDNNWEGWDDRGGGSGYTKILRVASQAEINNYNIYQSLLENNRKVKDIKQ